MWKFRAIRAETALAAIAMRWAEEEAKEEEEEAWDRERRWIVFEKQGQASKPQCGKPQRWWQWPQIIARSQQPKQQRQWIEQRGEQERQAASRGAGWPQRGGKGEWQWPQLVARLWQPRRQRQWIEWQRPPQQQRGEEES